jgi:hypothetical protein
MKLSVIDSQQSETVVPRISEYANTQNRVNAADFFSNHPFHVRMEGFSRRIWAPAQKGTQRETKWFYERARGQYADAQSKLTPSEQRRFKAEHPEPQMITKKRPWCETPAIRKVVFQETPECVTCFKVTGEDDFVCHPYLRSVELR